MSLFGNGFWTFLNKKRRASTSNGEEAEAKVEEFLHCKWREEKRKERWNVGYGTNRKGFRVTVKASIAARGLECTASLFTSLLNLSQWTFSQLIPTFHKTEKLLNSTDYDYVMLLSNCNISTRKKLQICAHTAKLKKMLMGFDSKSRTHSNSPGNGHKLEI